MGRELNLAVRGRQLAEKLKFFASSPIHSFIILAGVFGMLTITLAPPLTGADEEAHFVRAYGISEGNVIIHQDENILMPKSYRQTIGCLQTREPIAGDVYTYKYERYTEHKKAGLRCALTINQDLNDEEQIGSAAAGYSPLTYIPQISAILIGRLFNMPLVVMVYLVRIFTLAAYIALITVAIRLLPNRKWALVGVSVSPVPILQIINPGADYMLIGSTAIFIAVILRSRSLRSGDLKKTETIVSFDRSCRSSLHGHSKRYISWHLFPATNFLLWRR